MANEFKVKKGLIVHGSGSTVLDIQGSQGQLFSITDDLTGTLFAVSDISGVPIFDVNADGTSNFDGNLNLGDNNKLQLGASQDLQMYHDGTNSYIVDAGAGDLLNYYSNDWKVVQYGSSEVSIWARTNEYVKLFYNGNEKLATTNTGVEVTGDLVITGNIKNDIENGSLDLYGGADATNDAHIKLYGNNSQWASIVMDHGYDAANSKFIVNQGGTERFKIQNNIAYFSGRVSADTHFQSSDTNVTLSATGTGNVYLRPNGYSNTSGQGHIDTNGNATFASTVKSTSGVLALGADVTLFRDGANILRTDDAFHANSNIYVGGAGKLYDRANNANYIELADTVNISTDTSISGNIEVNSSITTPTDTSLKLYPNGSGHLYLGDAGNGMNMYHYSQQDNGKYTTFTHNGTYYKISPTATSGLEITSNTKVSGDLTVTGKVTAQEFHTEFVSASIMYESGSTKFGDTSDDNHDFTGSLNVEGGLTINGSLSRGAYTGASNYHTGADNIVLKGNSVGISSIFFESEKDGTNINHNSDFGFIQYHAYGTGTSGESNELIIGVSNDTDDHIILNAPNVEGFRVRVGSSETEYKIYHEGHVPTYSEISGTPTIPPAITDYVTRTTTQTVTGAKTFSSSANHYKGHLYYDSHDVAGNHYPHFLDGSSSSGTTVHWRQYYGSNQKTHTWTSDSSGNMLFTYQGGIKAEGELEGTSLDINGNADISGTARIHSRLTFGGNVNNFIEGTGSSLDFKSNGDYFFRKGANTQLTILSNGKVGIGTTTPSTKLEVSTDAEMVAKFTGNTDDGTGYVGAVVEIESNNNARGRGVYLTHRDSTDTTDSEWYAGLPYTGTGYTIGNAAYGTSVNSDTGPAVLAQSRFFIKKDGNVGIGTTSPNSKLHVFEAGTSMITVDSGATAPYKAGIEFLRSSINGGSIYNDGNNVQIKFDSYFGYDSANPSRGGFQFRTAPVSNNTMVDAVRIDALGSVGIGTTAPSNKLQVAGAINALGFVNEEGGNKNRLLFPKGGSYNGGNPITGAIKVTLPTSWTNTMLTVTVRVFDYSTRESFDLTVAGYTYTGGPNWVNTSAWISSQSDSDRNFTVRFGHDGTKCCFYIGELTSTWSYLKVNVIDATLNHASTVTGWSTTAWAVGVESTAFLNVTSTQTGTQTNNWKRSGQNAYYASGTGNVGIGITSPTAKLHVVGDGIVSGNLTFKPKEYSSTDDLNNDNRSIFSTHQVNNTTSNRATVYSSVFTLGGGVSNALQISTNEDYNESGMFIRQYNQNGASPQGTGWQNWTEVWTTNHAPLTKITNWDTAYTYSQVGHLPLTAGSGKSLTGTLYIDSSSTTGNQAITFERSGQETYKITHGTSGLYFTHPNATSLLLGLTQGGDVTIHNSSSEVYVRFDQSSKYVGIGETAPEAKLHVVDDTDFTSGQTSVEVLKLQRKNTGGDIKATTEGHISMWATDSNNDTEWGRISWVNDNTQDGGLETEGAMSFWTSKEGTLTRAMYINHDQEIGIGTTSPQSRLDVQGGMSQFSTTLTNNEDWENSPISINERGQVGSAQSADKYAPNLNFHWGGRASKSLWLNSTGVLHFGEYSSTGIPDATGTFSVNTVALTGTGRITGVDTVSAGTDATSKTYVDNAITTATGNYLPLAGGIMTGNIVAGGNKYTLTVNAPTNLVTSIVNDTINVTFTASTTTNIDNYLIFSSVAGGDYGLISVIPPADFGATMSIIDDSFNSGGTQAYRVYAVKNGVYSSPLTGTKSFSVGTVEPTNMSVINLNTAYYIQYDAPSAKGRFITAYNIYKHEHDVQGSLDRTSATLIYSGMNNSYMYQISGNNNNKFHQFWVETTAV